MIVSKPPWLNVPEAVVDPLNDRGDDVAMAWNTSASRRFLALGATRGVVQVMGLIWFFAAARILSTESYGVLATALAFFAIFAGVGDLGTTRGVVRHVAADHSLLWPVYRRAVTIRVAGGLAVGVVVAGVVALLPVPVEPGIVLLAGLVATASGATEIAYAALRSVGLVRPEMSLLLGERVAFLGGGLLVLQLGGEVVAILVLYLATNLVSALICGWQVRRSAGVPGPDDGSWSLSDGEARSTAVAFALVTMSPRIVPVMLALLASAIAVADFSVAQRPIEAMTLFALSTAAPVLPIVRERLAAGRQHDAERAAVSVVTAICLALAPMLAWFVVEPTMVLDLFFGTDRYDSASTVLRILAVTALTWSFRGVAEFVLLAEERAKAFLWVTIIGVGATLVLAYPFITAWGSTGGAWLVLVAEVAMTVMLIAVAPALVSWAALRSYSLVAGAALATGATILLTRSSTLATVVAVGVWSAVALAGAVALSRRVDVASHG